MARRRRSFTAEFKIEAVRLAESGRPASAVARELQISDNLLRRWRREFAAAARSGAGSGTSSSASARDAFPGNGKLTSQDEEIRQLRRRVAQLEEEREILKSGGLLRQGIPVRYRFIEAHRTEHAVVTMCRVLGVSKAGYYAWRDRAPSERELFNRRLAAEIRTVHRQSRRAYGSPRVHAELVAGGARVNRKRVERVMRLEGIRAKRKRKFRVTTDSRHAEPIAPNVLQREFSVEQVAGRDRVWAGDITYIPTLEGWLYLAVVLDLGTRRVVGWAMRHTLERRLACDPLVMALQRRCPEPGVLHHSDRGCQYASGDFRALLESAGMTSSMSRKGDCWDNAVVESFVSTLKSELVEDAAWATREEARLALFEWIEVWYNGERRHSSLGYMSPTQYEQAMQQVAA